MSFAIFFFLLSSKRFLDTKQLFSKLLSTNIRNTAYLVENIKLRSRLPVENVWPSLVFALIAISAPIDCDAFSGFGGQRSAVRP